jgi:H+-transporting ATPase
VHKRTEATIKATDGTTFKVTKGAPQVILELSANAAAVKAVATRRSTTSSRAAFVPSVLPERTATANGSFSVCCRCSIRRAKTPGLLYHRDGAPKGVKIKMVTGDALAIARETTKTLGMGSNILDGATLGDAKSNETSAVAHSIEQADGFAQVFPEHKFHIVDAVFGATGAARAAAAIVLMTPSLSVIIDAIKESRRIFQRMSSYAMYRIAETLRVLLFMTLAIVVFNFYPLTAVMIVMLALLNDGAILPIAYDNVH